MRKARQHFENPEYSGPDSEGVDITLDITSIVLSTLRNASKIAAPLLYTASGTAINIVGAVQKARRNKNGLKALANDSCELVYVIIRAHKDLSSVEDMPKDLTENLQQLVRTLTSIKIFAETGASRNFLISMLRSGVDAERIEEYREKLRQSMRVFGLQSDIILRDTVAMLASRQVEMMSEIKARATSDTGPNGSARASLSPSSPSMDPEPQAPVLVTPRDAKLEKAFTTTINAMADNELSDTGNSLQAYRGMVTIGIAGAFIGITMLLIPRVFRRL